MISRLKGQGVNLALGGVMWFCAAHLGIEAWKFYGYAAALSTPYQIAQFRPGFLHTMCFSVVMAVFFLVLPVRVAHSGMSQGPPHKQTKSRDRV